MAPVAAEIIAGRPPTTEITTAIVNDANSPTLGSTPAMMENEIASGINASATTRPARTSVRATRGDSHDGRENRARVSDSDKALGTRKPDMIGHRQYRRGRT
jgi:hypothetical protein